MDPVHVRSLMVVRPRLPWLARITGPDQRYGLARVFVPATDPGGPAPSVAVEEGPIYSWSNLPAAVYELAKPIVEDNGRDAWSRVFIVPDGESWRTLTDVNDLRAYGIELAMRYPAQLTLPSAGAPSDTK